MTLYLLLLVSEGVADKSWRRWLTTGISSRRKIPSNSSYGPSFKSKLVRGQKLPCTNELKHTHQKQPELYCVHTRHVSMLYQLCTGWTRTEAELFQQMNCNKLSPMVSPILIKSKLCHFDQLSFISLLRHEARAQLILLRSQCGHHSVNLIKSPFHHPPPPPPPPN